MNRLALRIPPGAGFKQMAHHAVEGVFDIGSAFGEIRIPGPAQQRNRFVDLILQGCLDVDEG